MYINRHFDAELAPEFTKLIMGIVTDDKPGKDLMHVI